MDKKYIKNVLIYVLTGVLSLVGIGYIVFHLTGSDVDTVSTEVAILTQTETRVQAQGMILRDEVAIEGTGKDICSIEKDGTNVMAGTEVLHIFSGGGNVSEKIEEYEKRIAILKSSLAGKGIPTAHNSNEKELKELYYTMLDTVHGGSLLGTEEIGVQLQTCINLRKHSSVTESAIKESIANLEKERDDLLAANRQNVTDCVAPVTGLYYRGSDGFEALCTLQAAKEMSYGDFMALKDTVGAPDMTKGVGRIATDSYWYLALTLPAEVARELKVGQQYPIGFDENKGVVVYMTLERMDAEYKQSDCLAVFGCHTVPTDFNFKRTQNVTLLTRTVEGIRVPAHAVRYVEGQVGVYVTEGNKVVFRHIDVLCATDGYYTVKRYDTSQAEYADMLRLHDKIILTGKGLYHGKYLR